MAYIETKCVAGNNSRLKHSETNPRKAISLLTLQMMPDERMGHLVPAGDRTGLERGALPPFHPGSGQGRIAVVGGLHEHTQRIDTCSVSEWILLMQCCATLTRSVTHATSPCPDAHLSGR